MSDIIKDIQKNSKEIIRVEVTDFKGMKLINLRIWFQAIDENGAIVYKPSQKGIALNISQFNELKDAIDRLEVYIKDKGIQIEQQTKSS